MTLRLWAGVFLVLVLGGSAWAWHGAALERRLVVGDPDALPAEIATRGVSTGKAVYAAHCAGCHGPAGQGDASAGVPAFTDQDWLYGLGKVSDIEQTIAHGVRAANGRSRALAIMPAYATPRPSPTEAIPSLSPGDIADVTAYVLSSGGKPADPGAAGRGAAIFQDRGGCFDCHGADGKGDPAVGAPDLTDAIWLKGDGSARSIADTISHGSAGMCAAWLGVLSAAELRAAALYVHSLSQSR